MLEWVVHRIRLAKQVEVVVVETSTEPQDKGITEYCDTNDIGVRGGKREGRSRRSGSWTHCTASSPGS